LSSNRLLGKTQLQAIDVYQLLQVLAALAQLQLEVCWQLCYKLLRVVGHVCGRIRRRQHKISTTATA
jgi:hypothetical protein